MAVIKRRGRLQEVEAAPAQPKPQTLHDQLVERARRWLKGTCGCSAVLTELRAFTGSGECPDAIGWRAEYSISIECKTSRADFLADRKKPFRCDRALGVGTYRFYLCPPDLIAPEELPDGWGLLYAGEKQIRRVAGPIGNAWSHGDNKRFINARNQDAEIAMLVSAHRRSASP